jgi:hypothetical protein
MKIACCVLLVAGLLICAIACDDSTSVPPSVQDAATKAKAQGPQGPLRPTTQELLQGSRKRLALTPLPFSVNVPTSWKIDSLGSGSITVLTGPTPSGEAQIQLSSRSTIKKEDLEVVQRAAKKETTQPTTDVSNKTVKAEFRKLGEVEIFERQALGMSGPLTITNPDGTERTENATNFKWTLMLFVPQGNEYARHEMNFVALTAEQLKQDKELLEGILKSLQYEPGNAAPATQP